MVGCNQGYVEFKLQNLWNLNHNLEQLHLLFLQLKVSELSAKQIQLPALMRCHRILVKLTDEMFAQWERAKMSFIFIQH